MSDRLDAHRRHTREAYDRLAPVWSATTDDGPFNAHLERPAVRALIPPSVAGRTVLDAGCGSGAMCEWLLDAGAEVIGLDLSPAMIDEARRRIAGRDRLFAADVADLADPLPLPPDSVDGIVCSLTLHYLRDWTVPLRSFAAVLRPGGWAVISLDHPFGEPFATQRSGYFDPELVSDTWRKADVEVTQQFWRRPLAMTVAAFADAGFSVDRIVEARPSAEALRRFPDELGRAATRPSFIVFRLILPSRTGRAPDGSAAVAGPSAAGDGQDQ